MRLKPARSSVFDDQVTVNDDKQAPLYIIEIARKALYPATVLLARLPHPQGHHAVKINGTCFADHHAM